MSTLDDRTAARARQEESTEPFPIEQLNADRKGRLAAWVLNNPMWVFGAMRLIAPVFRIPISGWYVITRHDHVREALAADDVFISVLRSRFQEMTTGQAVEPLDGDALIKDPIAFVLSVDHRDAHARALRQLMTVLRPADGPRIAAMAEGMAQQIIDEHRALVEKHGPEVPFDAIEGLVTRVPTQICREYYGLDIPPELETTFGHWCIAVSTYVFAPDTDPPYRQLAFAAAEKLRDVIDRSFERARATGPDDRTVIGRLLIEQAKERREPPPRERGQVGLSDEVLRSHLLGLVMGFVPTVTMAAGDMLDSLIGRGWIRSFRRRKFAAPTRQALEDGDDLRFERCLIETLRFKPINPGPFRCTAPGRSYTFENAGWFGRGSVTIPPGVRVLACTQSAMFDGRRVARRYAFDPLRDPADSLVFGGGRHACLGVFLARAQIAPTFRVLLGQHPARVSWRMQRNGPFPAHLLVKIPPQTSDPRRT